MKENRVDRIDILKMDTEGHGLKIIEGAKDLIHNERIGVIIMEIDPEIVEIEEITKNNGYEFYIYNCHINSLSRCSPLTNKKLEIINYKILSNMVMIHKNESKMT